MTEAYEPITQENFIRILTEKLKDMPYEKLLDFYEIVSELLNDEILEQYDEENEHYLNEDQVLEQFLDGRTMREIKHKYNDDTALREDFNNYADMLCKDGEISEYLYNNMHNPF